MRLQKVRRVVTRTLVWLLGGLAGVAAGDALGGTGGRVLSTLSIVWLVWAWILVLTMMLGGDHDRAPD